MNNQVLKRFNDSANESNSNEGNLPMYQPVSQKQLLKKGSIEMSIMTPKIRSLSDEQIDGS